MLKNVTEKNLKKLETDLIHTVYSCGGESIAADSDWNYTYVLYRIDEIVSCIRKNRDSHIGIKSDEDSGNKT